MAKVLASFEYDNFGYPSDAETIQVREDGMKFRIVVCKKKEEIELFSADRDQWGLWVNTQGHVFAQEDETRSFLDGLIESLKVLRECGECDTQKAESVLFRDA